MKTTTNTIFWGFVVLVLCIAIFYSYQCVQEGYSGRKRNRGKQGRNPGKRRSPHRRHRRPQRYPWYMFGTDYNRNYHNNDRDVYIYNIPPYRNRYYNRYYDPYYDPYYRPYYRSRTTGFTDYLRWLFGYPPLEH